MRTILAFGDSLTWGTNVALQRRHDFNDRWPSVLQAELGGSFNVIAEGLGGRTTMYDDPGSPVNKNGAEALPILLGSHNPLDLLIIMLGANDLKPHLCGTAEGAAKGIRELIQITETFPYNWNAAPPEVLVVSSPYFREKSDGSGPEAGRSVAESRRLAPAYSALVDEVGARFWDAAKVASASAIDGVHLDAANTREIGRGLVPVVRQILKV